MSFVNNKGLPGIKRKTTMNELKMKAKAGVTLVELLVVILIVTILSVSMLPLLQPFVTEAQYAAEAIPVIGTLRTKVGMYQYDKNRLPSDWGKNGPATDNVHTWQVSDNDSEQYWQSKYSVNSGDSVGSASELGFTDHVGKLLSVGFKDLLGRRSKPLHYHYFPISVTNNMSYAIGCFGDGNGLKMGTGYAVCELVYPKKKYIGVWKRYAPEDDSKTVRFDVAGTLDGNCYVPKATDFDDDVAIQGADGNTEVIPSLVRGMALKGWDFGFEIESEATNSDGGS